MVAKYLAARLGTVNNVAVATTSSSVASSAFGSETWYIRIASPAVCFYKVDYAPTAAATDAMLPANWVEYVKVSPSQKLSVFSATVQTVSVVELSE
jgi:hypothetical protein